MHGFPCAMAPGLYADVVDGGWRVGCLVLSTHLLNPPSFGAPHSPCSIVAAGRSGHMACVLVPWAPGTGHQARVCVCMSVSMGYGRCWLSPRHSLWVYGHSFQPLMVGHTLLSMTCNVSTCLLACERSGGVHFSLCPSIALVVTAGCPKQPPQPQEVLTAARCRVLQVYCVLHSLLGFSGDKDLAPGCTSCTQQEVAESAVAAAVPHRGVAAPLAACTPACRCCCRCASPAAWQCAVACPCCRTTHCSLCCSS
jgi:hypothetical protein